METFMSLAFMVFSFGFFLFSMRLVSRDHRESWEQRMQEAREFGVGGLRKPTKSDTKILHEK
jgi:hypothetical protein